MASGNQRQQIRHEMASRAQAWNEQAPGTAPASGKKVGGSLPSGLNASHGAADDFVALHSGHYRGMSPGTAGAGLGVGGSALKTSAALVVAPSNGEFGAVGGMEGPLPSEARTIIHQHCSGDTAEQAELYARRLLSTHRRVRVYKEELSAAVEEAQDMTDCLEKSALVQAALRRELSDLDARIVTLQKEKQLVSMQAEQEARNGERLASKFHEAQQRVTVLRGTIDTIAKDTQRGQMMLLQLVPNLQIDNYS